MSPTIFGPLSGSDTPLIRVVKRGDENMARLLVTDLGNDPNYIVNADFTTEATTDESHWPEVGNTALLSAIASNNVSMVNLLVDELGADVNLKTPRQILHHNIWNTKVKYVKAITMTPLLFAIEKENARMLLLLLYLGAEPLVRGWTKGPDGTYVCGNSLQLATIRFGDREPAVLDQLKKFRELSKRKRKQQKEITTRLVSDKTQELSAKLELHEMFMLKLKKHIECNICIDVPARTDKVFVCQNSHIFCQCCIHRVAECPLCKVNFILTKPTRSRLAEAIIHDIAELNLN